MDSKSTPELFVALDLPDYEPAFAAAIEQFWEDRAGQMARQRLKGLTDAGTRGSVTGGTHLHAVRDVLHQVIIDAGRCSPAALRSGRYAPTTAFQFSVGAKSRESPVQKLCNTRCLRQLAPNFYSTTSIFATAVAEGGGKPQYRRPSRSPTSAACGCVRSGGAMGCPRGAIPILLTATLRRRIPPSSGCERCVRLHYCCQRNGRRCNLPAKSSHLMCLTRHHHRGDPTDDTPTQKEADQPDSSLI